MNVLHYSTSKQASKAFTPIVGPSPVTKRWPTWSVEFDGAYEESINGIHGSHRIAGKHLLLVRNLVRPIQSIA